MTKSILVWLLATVLLVTVPIVEAQQAAKIPRMGYLTSALDRSNPNRDAFRQGLRDLGSVEGQNILIEYRYAEGKNERLTDLLRPSSAQSRRHPHHGRDRDQRCQASD